MGGKAEVRLKDSRDTWKKKPEKKSLKKRITKKELPRFHPVEMLGNRNIYL